MSVVDIRLLDLIIGQNFGEINRRVANVLASKGPLNSVQIAQFAKLPLRAVRESLFVLIHHNLVRWSTPCDALGVPQTQVINFHLDLGLVFLRLAYPLFIQIVQQRLGQDAALVSLEICKLGRASKNNFDKTAVDALLAAGFVEVVSIGDSKIEKEPVEQNSVQAAISPSKKRKATPDSPVKLRKKEVSFIDSIEKKEYIRINAKSFINCIWYEQLVKMARRKVNDSAGSVLESVLSLSGLEASTSRTLLNNFQISHKIPHGTKFLVETDTPFSRKSNSPLVEYLDTMARDLPFFVKAGEQAGGQYYLDFPASIEALRVESILAYARTRFGQPSARIVKLILAKKYLEEKAVSRIAMLSGKEARERLFILLQHGLVHLQEIPRSADHAPSRTIFLWTVPLDRIRFAFVSNIRKILVNLLERVQFERSKYRLLVAKTERSDVAANPGLLSSLERAQLEALNQSLGRLEFQVCRIMTEYTIFNEIN